MSNRVNTRWAIPPERINRLRSVVSGELGFLLLGDTDWLMYPYDKVTPALAEEYPSLMDKAEQVEECDY